MAKCKSRDQQVLHITTPVSKPPRFSDRIIEFGPRNPAIRTYSAITVIMKTVIGKFNADFTVAAAQEKPLLGVADRRVWNGSSRCRARAGAEDNTIALGERSW
jgi:hypothetical protein